MIKKKYYEKSEVLYIFDCEIEIKLVIFCICDIKVLSICVSMGVRLEKSVYCRIVD